MSPEMDPYWLLKELDQFPTRPQDRFNISEEDKRIYREVLFPYWEKRSMKDFINGQMTDEVKAAVEPWEGKELTVAEMQKPAEAIASTLRAKGYPLAQAFLPPQRVDGGTLEIKVQEGVVDGSGVPRDSGHRLAGSYVNFLITNERIVYPLLDPATDDLAQAKLEEIFPDHTVVGVPAREILLGGGNIHCITQQIPSGK